MESGFESDPSESKLSLEQKAILAEENSDWDLTVEVRRALSKIDPQNALNICRLSFALRRKSDFDAAEDLISESLFKFPDSDIVELESAWIAHERNDWLLASTRWSRVYTKHPNSISAGCCWVTALSNLKRFDEAEALGKDIQAKYPENPSAVAALAWVYHNRCDWTSATDRWRRVLEIEPNNMSAGCCLVTSLTQGRRFDEAETAAQKLLEIHGGHAQILRSFAWISHTNCDWSNAAARWKLVAEIAPDDAAAYACLAAAYREMRQFNDAETAIRRAIELSPDTLIYQIELALTAQMRGDSIEAQKRWGDLWSRHGQNPALAGTIGYHRMLAQLNQIDVSPPTSAPNLNSVGISNGKLEPRDILMQVESLGDNCEFGGVQRHFGAEPLGLLRFASITAKDLETALFDRFEKMGTPNGVRLEINDSGEYIIHDSYNVSMHSFVHAKDVNNDRFHAQILRRTAFLRRKLISDLEVGEKLFVYKARAGMSKIDAFSLHAVMETFGHPVLLCIFLSDLSHQPGFVEVLKKGLFVGYLSRFAYAEGLVDSAYDEWLSVVQKALSIQQGWLKPNQPSIGKSDSKDLVLQFEAFGTDCEFGGVQRHFGAEPLGLLRFTGISTKQLIDALDNDLHGIGDPLFTRVTAEGDRKEFFSFDTRYRMSSHTFVYEGEVDPADFFKRQCRKISFLARKMKEDLQVGAKVLVHRIRAPEIPSEDILSLHRAVRRLGKNNLLIVTTELSGAVLNKVELSVDGLMTARIVDRVSCNPPGQPDHDFEGWVEVLKQARDLCGY